MVNAEERKDNRYRVRNFGNEIFLRKPERCDKGFLSADVIYDASTTGKSGL